MSRLIPMMALGLLFLAPRTATAASDCPDPAARRPGVAMVIDRRVFEGSAKGLLGGDHLVLATRLSNSAWTSFFDRLTPRAILGYVSDPSQIPPVAVGDGVNLTLASWGAAYNAMENTFPAGSTLVFPVVTVDGKRTGTVNGFATVELQRIRGRGKARSIEGRLLSLELCPDANVGTGGAEVVP